jgi:hypothetical protein
MFPGRLISRFGDITWPARSPDLPIPDHNLCGDVKSKVYGTSPVNIDNPKQSIRACVQGIFKEILQRVVTHFQSHWSALNDMVVTFKVQYSKSNDSDHGYGIYLLVVEKTNTMHGTNIKLLKIPTGVNKIVPLYLKISLHFKNRQIYLTQPIFASAHVGSIFILPC